MFNRKVLVIALMAVVLLTSFMDGSVSADARQIRKRRVKTAEVITQTVPAMLQAAGQVDQMAMRSLRHKGRKAAFELGDQLAMRSFRHKGRKAAFELGDQLALRSFRHRVKKTAFELGDQMALRSFRHKVRKTTFEPGVQTASRPVIKEPRKHRII